MFSLYETIYDNINIIYNKIIDKNIVIYGYGKGGKFIKDILKRYFNYEANIIIDNNLAINNSVIFKTGDYIKNIDISNTIILVASNYADEIYNEVNNIGFTKNINFFNLLEDLNCSRRKNSKLIEDNSIINGSVRIEEGVKIGRYTYGYKKFIHTKLNGMPMISEIGSFCSINSTAVIVANHPTNLVSTHPFLYDLNIGQFMDENTLKNEGIDFFSYNKKISIGNDVWIGENVVILPGVTIGNGSIIAAGAVVNKDVPDYSVVGGVPGKVLKYRFNNDQIFKLNKIQWWNWDIEQIKQRAKYFLNIDEFIRLFYI